jgi:hypothetical protein
VGEPICGRSHGKGRSLRPFPATPCGRVPPSSRGHPPSRQPLVAGRGTAIWVTCALAAMAGTVPAVGRRRRVPECGPDRRRKHQADQHAHDDCAKRNIQNVLPPPARRFGARFVRGSRLRQTAFASGHSRLDLRSTHESSVPRTLLSLPRPPARSWRGYDGSSQLPRKKKSTTIPR